MIVEVEVVVVVIKKLHMDGYYMELEILSCISMSKLLEYNQYLLYVDYFSKKFKESDQRQRQSHRNIQFATTTTVHPYLLNNLS